MNLIWRLYPQWTSTARAPNVAVDILRAVEASPLTMRGASGRRQRVYRELVGLGAIEAPAERWPTARGVAWVERGGAKAPAAEAAACQ